MLSIRVLARRGWDDLASLLLRSPLMGTMQSALDLLILGSAFVLGYLLRFDFSLTQQTVREMVSQIWYVVAIQAVVLHVTGIKAFIWRYIGLVEFNGFVKAALLSAAPVLALRLGLPETLQDFRVPLSIVVIDTGLAFGGLLGARVVRRLFYESLDPRRSGPHTAGHAAANHVPRKSKRTLIIGAGDSGVLAAREIRRHHVHEMEIVGFVDDYRPKRTAVVQGVPVLGVITDLPDLVAAHRIDQVIVAIAEVTRRDIKRITAICDSLPVTLKIVPAMYELLDGSVNATRIRDIRIEDLLGRTPVHLEEHEIRQLLTHRTVLVTGAGGSIGSELTRQVCRFSPSVLLLVERSELALYNIERELRQKLPELVIVPLMADIGDENRMRSIFTSYRPSIVLHAAAHKHVPLMELNPSEAVKNNVIATSVLARLAGEAGVNVFVLISTDKAVRPKSVMGATKRFAELVIQSLNHRFRTRYVAVRFGNVIGSAGSVIPLFHEQIRRGGPITVTHPDMVRYFMTIPEASQLVLQAAAIGEGGEIFILDMGEPVKILDIAIDTIRLSGLRPNEDIDIVFTGLRPGEKLFEELEFTGENITNTRHPKIFIGRIASLPPEVVDKALERLSAPALLDRHSDVRRLLNTFIPEADLTDDAAPPAVVSLVSEGALPVSTQSPGSQYPTLDHRIA